MHALLRAVIKNHKRFLFGLFAVSLAVRALLFIFFTSYGTNAWIPYDSEQYHAIACNIAQGNGIALKAGVPQVYRVPGYPLFLAACEKAFGFCHPGAPWEPGIHSGYIQIILASLMPGLIFMLGMVLAMPVLLAKIAACIASVHLGFVLYAGMLATESLCCLFLLLFFLCFFSRSFFFAGLALGLASLVRPVGLPLLVVACVMMLRQVLQAINPAGISEVSPVLQHGVGLQRKSIVPEGRNKRIGPPARKYFFFTYPGSSQRRAGANASQAFQLAMCNVSALTIGWFMIVTPWLVRNFLLTGTLLFHTLPGIHCVQYLAAPIVAQRDAVDYATARATVIQEWYAQCSGDLNDVPSCRVGEKIGLAYVMQHPFYAFKYVATEIFKTCFGLCSAIILLADAAVWPSEYEGASWITKIKRFLFPTVQRPFLVPLIYWDILLTIFITVGFALFLILSFFDKNLWNLLWQILPFIALFIALTFAYGGARLRMPAEPLLILGAVYGWVRLCKKN